MRTGEEDLCRLWVKPPARPVVWALLVGVMWGWAYTYLVLQGGESYGMRVGMASSGIVIPLGLVLFVEGQRWWAKRHLASLVEKEESP